METVVQCGVSVVFIHFQRRRLSIIIIAFVLNIYMYIHIDMHEHAHICNKNTTYLPPPSLSRSPRTLYLTNSYNNGNISHTHTVRSTVSKSHHKSFIHSNLSKKVKKRTMMIKYIIISLMIMMMMMIECADSIKRTTVTFSYGWRFHYGDDPSAPPMDGTLLRTFAFFFNFPHRLTKSHTHTHIYTYTNKHKDRVVAIQHSMIV